MCGVVATWTVAGWRLSVPAMGGCSVDAHLLRLRSVRQHPQVGQTSKDSAVDTLCCSKWDIVCGACVCVGSSL